MKILILFAIATAINVILSTVKSLLTIKAGKTVAALANAITYGFYTWVIILTNIDGISLWVKMGITALCNFIGVFIVKWIEEKARKEKLWKIEATFDKEYLDTIHKMVGIPHSYIDIGNHVIFNFYAENQRQSAIVRDVINKYHGKYFVSESKVL
jgi:hypothetical protein